MRIDFPMCFCYMVLYALQVRKYEQSCGALSSYGRKYMGAFANMCNSGVGEERLASVTNRVCAHQ